MSVDLARLDEMIAEYRDAADSNANLSRVHGTASIGEFVGALAELRAARERIAELEAALMRCKHVALTSPSAQGALHRIVRLAIDAGITMNIDEIEAAFKVMRR